MPRVAQRTTCCQHRKCSHKENSTVSSKQQLWKKSQGMKQFRCDRGQLRVYIHLVCILGRVREGIDRLVLGRI